MPILSYWQSPWQCLPKGAKCMALMLKTLHWGVCTEIAGWVTILSSFQDLAIPACHKDADFETCSGLRPGSGSGAVFWCEQHKVNTQQRKQISQIYLDMAAQVLVTQLTSKSHSNTTVARQARVVWLPISFHQYLSYWKERLFLGVLRVQDPRKTVLAKALLSALE